MTKADLRRAARKQREVEWAAFDLTRPDDKAENPADLAAIEAAKKHMGDYKLKSDPSYIIPEEVGMHPAPSEGVITRLSPDVALHLDLPLA